MTSILTFRLAIYLFAIHAHRSIIYSNIYNFNILNIKHGTPATEVRTESSMCHIIRAFVLNPQCGNTSKQYDVEVPIELYMYQQIKKKGLEIRIESTMCQIIKTILGRDSY